MMDTTTSDGGDSIQGVPVDENGTAITQDESQPQQSEAVAAETQVEATSQEQPETEAQNQETTAVESTQAGAELEGNDEVVQWAEKKGLKINPDNPNEVKLARMQLENDRRFHESRQNVNPPEHPEGLELTGNDVYDQIISRQNEQDQRTFERDLQLYVRDWFEANPDMKPHREELTRIALEKPWLNRMEDVQAHFLSDPKNLERVKKDAGRQALTNLAQKQAAVPPGTNASNTQSFNSNAITPENVDAVVSKMSAEEYQRRLPEINAALQAN